MNAAYVPMQVHHPSTIKIGVMVSVAEGKTCDLCANSRSSRTHNRTWKMRKGDSVAKEEMTKAIASLGTAYKPLRHLSKINIQKIQVIYSA